MRHTVIALLLSATAVVAIGAAGAAPSRSAPTTEALGLVGPWSPDPFPLGACVDAPELGDEPVCVIVDPDGDR